MEEEVKVSELVEASIINDDDLLMIIQNGINKKALFSKVISRVQLGDTGWIDFDLLTGFTYNANQNRPQYRKIGNVVYLKGLVYSDGNSTGTTYQNVAQLPTGYRPTTVGAMAYLYFTSRAGNGTIIAPQITPEGYLKITNSMPSGTFVSLDGISFPIG